MRIRSGHRLAFNSLLVTFVACSIGASSQDEGDLLREIEHQRLRALVEADMDVARRLHADDFQLFTPDGTEFTKDSYLGQIASGELDYKVWHPGPIRVRLYDGVAAIRYDDSSFEVFVNGQLVRSGLLRHTNLYEKRNGQWQIVWSHASGGQ